MRYPSRPFSLLSRRFTVARALLALGLLLLPIGGAVPVAAQTPGTLVIDTTAESESMDPGFVTQVSGNSVMSSIFDSLVERGYDGSIQPVLAESWSIPDATTVEFKLRQGVTFHNGEPFHAGAVKFSIDRLMDPTLAAPLAGAMPKSFQSVEVIDDFTVRFHFSQPEASIFDALAQCCAIVPPGYYTENSREFVAANPVGSGPFRFIEWVRDDHTTVAANTAYWGGDTYKGTPLVQTVIFRPVPAAGTRVADLLNGTADMIFDLSPDDVDTVRGLASTGYQIVPSTAARLQFIEFMPKKPTDPLADRRVRQALNYAVDVQSLIDNLFKGLGVRQASPILTGALGHDPGVQAYDYNPDLARQLLADAGYPQGFSATMDLANADNPAPALAVVGQLKQIGVEITPRTLELATFNANWNPEKSGDLRIARWGGMQDPAVFLNFTTVCGGFLADPYTCNQEATALAKQAASTLDQGERARLYGQVARILRDDPMGIYLSNAVSIYGVGPRVQGWRGSTGRDYLIPTNITLAE
jgi:peptide/nickel transport system substrate-binding protein